MNNVYPYKGISQDKIENLHEGQKIIYNGKEAFVIKIKPVIVLKIKGKSEVICGNILNGLNSPELIA